MWYWAVRLSLPSSTLDSITLALEFELAAFFLHCCLFSPADMFEKKRESDWLNIDGVQKAKSKTQRTKCKEQNAKSKTHVGSGFP